MRVRDLLNERFINAIGNDEQAMATKAKYRDAVWDMLQRSYAPIGGIKGKGFESPEEMLKLPMWKIAVRGGKLRAVIIYKDKNGRKAVAVGTDGSSESKTLINDILRNEPTRSYSEKSKAALGKDMKTIPSDQIEDLLSTPDEVRKLFPGKEITAISDLPRAQWPEDAIASIGKYPILQKYGYVREIGGTPTFKVLIGTPGLSLK